MEKQHLAALDGLRALASIAVVVYHIGHWLGVPGIAPNASFAVDFFFCLSGYVLVLAYRKRLDAGMSTAHFMRLRLQRLWPLIAVATIVSIFYVVLRGRMTHQPVEMTSVISALVLGLASLPLFNAPHAIGGPQIFPLNGPQYSLFLEFAVNLFWAATRNMRPLAVAVAVYLASLAALSLIGYAGAARTDYGGDTTATFLNGFPRVGAAFFSGVALYHIQAMVRMPDWIGRLFWPATILMAAILFAPLPLGGGFALAWTAVLSPMLVLIGSRAHLSPLLRKAALFGGALSYPVYILHYPIFCWVNGVYQVVNKGPDFAAELPLLLVAIFGGSYAALHLIDEPMRKLWSQTSRRTHARALRQDG